MHVGMKEGRGEACQNFTMSKSALESFYTLAYRGQNSACKFRVS